MGLKHRMARLERDASGQTCCCQIELIEAPEGEPDPTEAGPPSGPGDARGRPFCERCGLPLRPDQVRFIVVRLAVVGAHDAATDAAARREP